MKTTQLIGLTLGLFWLAIGAGFIGKSASDDVYFGVGIVFTAFSTFLLVATIWSIIDDVKEVISRALH